VAATTAINAQQTSSVQQGQGSTNNTVSLAVNASVDNQGSAQASTGDTTASGQVGGTTVKATLTSSASPSASASSSASASPSAASTATTSSTPGTTVSISTTASAQATSGSAAAVGVNATTNIAGTQAVTVHIPPDTNNQTINISLNVSVSNTGSATSQSGNVNATGLQGSNTVGVGAPAPTLPLTANSLTASAPAGGTGGGSASVDVRDSTYALANSGDALAIGVQATTIIDGLQQLHVIIDDNSSGNRIVLTFIVNVANTGVASATTGNTQATGQQGSFAAAVAGSGAGSSQTTVSNTAVASSGTATALGVAATTLMNIAQDADMVVGDNSSNNTVLVDFEAYVLNQGTATAQTGTASALGQLGDTTVSLNGAPSGTSVSTSSTSMTVTDSAVGRSGDAASVGVQANTNLTPDQRVHLTLNNSSATPISISQADHVINLGLAQSKTGDVNVIAQVAPPPPPAAGPSPSPSPSAPAQSPAPSPSAAAAPGGRTFQVAAPSNMQVVLQPASINPGQSSAVAGATADPSALQEDPRLQADTAGADVAAAVHTLPAGQHGRVGVSGASMPSADPSAAGSGAAPKSDELPSSFDLVLVTAPRAAEQQVLAAIPADGSSPFGTAGLMFFAISLLPGLASALRFVRTSHGGG